MSSLKSDSSPTHEGSDDSDDFVMLDEPVNLSVRAKGTAQASEPSPDIKLNSSKSSNSLLITIKPPSKPVENIKHVSCDIVLVIDVSGSMAELAPLPDVEDEQERESSGLTVLDLVRHACRTIISTLNDNDRLALVTFSQDSRVVQPLTNMTATAKSDTLEKVEGLKDEGATNLWAGIRAGLQQFERNPPVGNVQGLYVLTDGQPNYMCPQQGYIPKMQPLLQDLLMSNGSAPSIQTFGFGYSIRSDLMLSIAKVGNGNFAFIPDVGMIGTVFVHAVANLYATYASNAVVELSLGGKASVVDLEHNSGLPVDRPDPSHLVIKLGNLQYGQSRDLLISCPSLRSLAKASIVTKLIYTPHSRSIQTMEASFSLAQPSKMPQATYNYHVQRNDLCNFLSMLYPVDPVKRQHTTIPIAEVASAEPKFQCLVEKLASIPSHKSDPDISSLLSDLIGTSMDPQSPGSGQVYQALQTAPQNKDGRVTKSYWHKWGRHYLSSLWCAHMRQTCNTFKDPGPLRYGINSEVFQKCRDELDAAFDNLPAPVGTHTSYVSDFAAPVPGGGRGGSRSRGMQTFGAPASVGHGLTTTMTFRQSRAPLDMSRYNRRDNVCFLGTCMIRLANGQSTMVKDLRTGDELYSPMTKTRSKVAEIVRGIYGSRQEICRVNDNLWITPWHPIFHQQGRKWVFPQSIAAERRTLRDDDEAVYSILLEPSDKFDHHAVEVEGVVCTTLGHGMIFDLDADCRAHLFFGDYQKVEESLARLPRDQHGHRLCSGVTRSRHTGLACDMFMLDQYLYQSGPELQSTARL